MIKLRGKVLVKIPGIGKLNYYCGEDVNLADRVKVISGVYRNRVGVIADVGNPSYNNYLEQVQKLQPRAKMPLSLKQNLAEGVSHFKDLIESYEDLIVVYDNIINDPNIEWTNEL